MRTILDTSTYLDGAETLRRRELEFGVVREPPAPFCSHQMVVTNLVVRLAPWVSARRLGRLLVSPVDVVLDAERALIVQPDVVFISTPRLGIIRDQVWGAPDLVVEVLSPGTTHHDRTKKLIWYRRYGVPEYWIVNPKTQAIEVVSFGDAGGRATRRHIRAPEPIASVVLTGIDVRVAELFD